AVEREVEVSAEGPALFGDGVTGEFAVEGGEDVEEGADGWVVRRRGPLAGAGAVRAAEGPRPRRAGRRHGPGGNPTEARIAPGRRKAALPSALVAAPSIITVSGGTFLSMTDPPEWASPAVAECRNEGGWPVLADPSGQVMLSSPIILYDHPELADESPGELYD